MTLPFATFWKTRMNTFIQGLPICSIPPTAPSTSPYGTPPHPPCFPQLPLVPRI